jgi:ATP-binding cassette subfamily F protein 3
VGANGAGKSTFLKIISNVMQPDRGEVAKRKDLIVGFLSQEFTLDETKNVYENILTGANLILNLIKEYEATPFDSTKKHVLEEKISHADGWQLERNIIFYRITRRPDVLEM